MNNVLKGDFKTPKPSVIINSKGYESPVEKQSKAADPITDTEIIANICDNFKERGKYRDNLLFTLGCNCGLRCGEIINLKWGQLINEKGECLDETVLIEEKNSKKNKEGEYIKGQIKTRSIYINETVKEAVILYLNSKERISLNDYVFKSESNTSEYYSKLRAEGKGAKHDHITRQAVDKILKKTVNEILHYDIHASTHCMRKTFARFIWDNSPDQRSALAFLQKTLGHSSPDSTLHYIGVTQDEIHNVVLGLNLGKRNTKRNNVVIANFKEKIV